MEPSGPQQLVSAKRHSAHRQPCQRNLVPLLQKVPHDAQQAPKPRLSWRALQEVQPIRPQ